ncbi:MAG: SDR family oxidoreductase [Rhodospirillales bacterium]|nr:SDR family oxidoreductase [Rhodospirillales bacterium]
MDLKNKVAIVTGAGTGIGAATAKLLATKGCRVVVNFRTSEAGAQATVAACKAAGSEALAVQGDVALDADCRRLADTAVNRWGRIDALVNNAGVTRYIDPANLEGLTLDDFHYIFGVNVFGAFQMTRAVVPHMRAVKQGAVVMVSSISGIHGKGSSMAYAVSKGALNTMTLSLARALGPEIRVNAVCPGTVMTDWGRKEKGDDYVRQGWAANERNVVLGRSIPPEEIASSIVWFIESGDTVTGSTLLIDGGQHLGPVIRPQQ